MKPLPFFLELKDRLPEDTWPWLITALRQDHWIWSALEETGLGLRALEALDTEAQEWTPAAISLLALNARIRPQDLSAEPMMPIEAELQLRADRAYQDWLASGPQPITSGSLPSSPDQALANCALIALALRERYRENSTWRGLFSAISLDRLETRTVLACLYGMISEPERLVRSLAEFGNGHVRPDLAVHTLICQPLPGESQARMFKSLQSQLSPEQSLDLLTKLAAQRPEMALSLAGDLLAS